MQNRYLYKAKRQDNGEWVEGALFDGENYCVIGRQIKFSPNIENECKIVGYIVDRNTICRYTGREDINGTLIWENDFVSFLDVSQYDNGYSEHWCIGKVVWDEETLSFQVTERISCESYEVLNGDCQVAGNIFDNPELL